MDEPWTIRRLLTWATPYFSRYAVDSPRLTAELLLAHALGLTRLDLFLQFDQPLEPGELAGFKTLVQRRVAGEPVAYMIGTQGFWTFELSVDPSVLIPRPETERLVACAVKRLPAAGNLPYSVVDLGTGSGAIVIALAMERPDHRYLAVERSAGALKTAQRNVRRLGVSDRVDLLRADWLSAVGSRAEFHLVVSNPPYIPTADIPGLQKEVAEHEPIAALDGGPDGLDCLRHLIHAAGQVLKPGGYLLMEMGWDQQPGLRAAAAAAGGFEDPVFFKDFAGLDRVVELRKK